MHTLKNGCLQILLLLLLFNTLQAQGRREVNMGFGTITFNHLSNSIGHISFGNSRATVTDLAMYGSVRFYGKKLKNSVNLLLGYDVSSFRYPATDGYAPRDVQRAYTLAVEGTLQYSKASAETKVYSSLGLGYSFIHDISFSRTGKTIDKSANIDFNITAIGIRMGEKKGAFFEFGMGYKGLISVGGFIRW
jgi:hypothetical protein